VKALAKKGKKAPGAITGTTIHEAKRAADGSGAVFKGAAIDEASAVARRKAGGDVVVCGSDLAANRRQAREIERHASSAFVFHNAHASNGPQALPHFQPATRPPQATRFMKVRRGVTRRKNP
jgi:hypothetical protein